VREIAMTSNIHPRIGFWGRLVVAALALAACVGFVAVADAAKVPKNSVGSKQIKKNAVKKKHIKDAAVVTTKIKDLAVTTDKVADAAITTGKIADAAVTTDKIADAAVTTDKIADAAVTTGKIADAAVTTDKIADDAITTGKIAPAAVRAEALGSTQQVVSSNVNIAATGNGSVTATCPAGTQVLSGGGGASSFTVFMVESFQQGNGWIAVFRNTDGSAHTIFATAVCLQQ
jgi:hypothetical protein